MPGQSPLLITNLSETAGRILTEALPVTGSHALGLPLVSNGHLGADLLRIEAHDAFAIHTHPGDHLLLCLDGEGTISIGGEMYQVRPGDLYLVPGMVPHAVGAGDVPHLLVAIGSPHKPVDAPDRMAFTDWDGNPADLPIFHRHEA